MSNLPQRPRPGSGSQKPQGPSETPGRRLPAKPQAPRSTSPSRSAGQRPIPQRPKPDQARTKPQPTRRSPERPPASSEPPRKNRIKPRPVEEETESVSPRRKQPEWEDTPAPKSYDSSPARKTRNTPYDDDLPEDFGFAEMRDEEEVIEHLNEEQEELNLFDEPEEDTAYVKEPKKGKKGRKKKPPKESKDQEQAITSGGRGGLFVLRAGIILVFLGFVGLGVKSIVAPPYVPSPDDVINMVNTDNNYLGFPIGEGSTFTQEFATAYLTVSKDEDSEEKLRKYTTDTLSTEIVANRGAEENVQAITDGPFVSPTVQQIDEFNAIFTVSAAINGKWVYLDVPVRTDETKNAFVVSAMPSFVSPPALIADYNQEPENRTIDDEITAEVNSDVESFFRAWGSSDSEALRRIIAPDATPEVNLGLRNAVKFSSMSNMQIYEPEDGNDNVRTGTAEIVWSTVEAEGDDSDTTYKQVYDITIEKLSDGRWYMKDVRSGSTSLS